MRENEIEFELTCPRYVSEEGYEGPCEAEIYVIQDILPSEIFGSDADGNRGVRLPPTIELNTDRLPRTCPLGHEFTQQEIKILADQIQSEIDSWCSDHG